MLYKTFLSKLCYSKTKKNLKNPKNTNNRKTSLENKYQFNSIQTKK